jgi:hypothetical protein
MNFAFDADIISELGCQQVVDVRNKLPVNPNYTWAQLAGVRELDDLTTIAFHHDAIASDGTKNASDLAYMTNIANSHINLKVNEPKGDAGFPYHIWIRNGTAYYANTLLDRTYGVASHNGYTVHVCVAGDYTQDKLSDANRALLKAVGLQLSRVLPNYVGIKGHGELNATKCPGYDYVAIREEVKTLQMKLLLNDTWESQMNRVGQLVNQINYMTGLLKAGKDDGNAQWAKNWLLDVHAIMKSRGLL